MDDGVSVDRLAEAVVARARSDDAVEQLAAATLVAGEVRDRADELMDRYVARARAGGRSWSEIGAALGVSKQAAQQRFVAAGAWPRAFDQDARGLIDAAHRHARELRHRYLGTEHLLLALTGDPGLAGTTLARLGVDAAAVGQGIRRLVGEGHSSATAALGISPRTKRVLENAGHEARRLGHRCPTAAPEHVLLAISAHRDAVGAQILRDLGADDERLRDELGELLAGEAPELAAKLRQPARRRLGRRSRS